MCVPAAAERAIAALGSALMYATYLVLTRKVANEADSLTLLFHANAIGAIAVPIPYNRLIARTAQHE